MIRNLLLIAAILVSPLLYGGEYSSRDDVNQFIDEMVKEHGFEREQLAAWLDQAEKKQAILDSISKPAEKEKTWQQYRTIFMTDERIKLGLQFWNENEATLAAVSKKYGVPPEMILGILGVETRYGRTTGTYRVIDALSTLGFDYPPRSKFFRGQLEEFFLLAREQKHDPLDLKGSYAGAMGYGQFIPSSYRDYAVDYNNDGFADIWNSPEDAIASIANYFKENGWKSGGMVVTRCRISENYDEIIPTLGLKPTLKRSELEAKGFTPIAETPADELFAVHRLEGEYGAEFWCAAKNFYAITRYNHSNMYALAAWQLSQAIRERHEHPDFDWSAP